VSAKILASLHISAINKFKKKHEFEKQDVFFIGRKLQRPRHCSRHNNRNSKWLLENYYIKLM
jgi:hypothetical protein